MEPHAPTCLLQARTRQVAGIIGLIAAFVVASLIVVGAAFVPAQGWPVASSDLGLMLISWFAVLVGTGVHLAVAAAKRRQQQEGLPLVVALGDLPATIEAGLGQILLKLLWALIGLFALVFATQSSGLNVMNSFLVGYSLDSVMDRVGTSLKGRPALRSAAEGAVGSWGLGST